MYIFEEQMFKQLHTQELSVSVQHSSVFVKYLDPSSNRHPIDIILSYLGKREIIKYETDDHK